jgi:hypothetical protein
MVGEKKRVERIKGDRVGKGRPTDKKLAEPAGFRV